MKKIILLTLVTYLVLQPSSYTTSTKTKKTAIKKNKHLVFKPDLTKDIKRDPELDAKLNMANTKDKPDIMHQKSLKDICREKTDEKEKNHEQLENALKKFRQ